MRLLIAMTVCEPVHVTFWADLINAPFSFVLGKGLRLFPTSFMVKTKRQGINLSLKINQHISSPLAFHDVARCM